MEEGFDLGKELYGIESKLMVPEKELARKPITVETIEKWVKSAPGIFSIRDLDYELGIKDSVSKAKRTRILEDLIISEVVSRDGDRRGFYRPFQKELIEMDYNAVSSKPTGLWMPFHIGKFVDLYPGSIVIVAGSPNAGKTAIMLNILKNNMNRFKSHYFNSEMDGAELKERLRLFDAGLWNFKAYSRNENFADVVFPGEGNLNIIDFLEVHDDFYKVGQSIKDIHSKLNGAIAVIGLQKNAGQENGLGGFRSMEKARLAITLDQIRDAGKISNKMKITKAKNFADKNVNPNGWEFSYRLAAGAKLYLDSGPVEVMNYNKPVYDETEVYDDPNDLII